MDWKNRQHGYFWRTFCASVLFISCKERNNDTLHYNNETWAKAESLYKLVDDFEFVVTLVVTRSILEYLLPVTCKSQAKDLDVAQSMDLVQSLKLIIKNLGNSVENYHENWYNKAKRLAEKVDISKANMTNLRTCSRQIYRSNQLF